MLVNGPFHAEFDMLRIHGICATILLFGSSLLIAQDEGKLQSGPKVGAVIPKPFECINVNGKSKVSFVEPKKGDKADPGYYVPRPHCLICKFALSPAVVIFAKEPVEGKDEAFTDLLVKLDETCADFDERAFQVGVVILSPDARDSTNNVEEKDAEAIIKEAVKRDELISRLKKRAEKLKHVVVCAHPAEGPKGYDINPKAEVTVLFYERMKVIENFAFAPGAMEAKDAKMIDDRIRAALPLRKKPPEPK